MAANTLVQAGSSIPKLLRSTLTWIVASPARAFIFIFILAFAVRGYSWIKVPPYLPTPARELGAIARSLVKTGQFANPYILETDPPAILAVVLAMFGGTSQAG